MPANQQISFESVHRFLKTLFAEDLHIAVGTRVTPRPPHRTVRAQLRHTAPTSDV